MPFLQEKEKDANEPSNVSFHLQQWWKSIIISESELFLHVADTP